MRKAAFILCLLFSLCSCEKLSRESNPDTCFKSKILDNYFVTSIAFDGDGNAWIGTFKQGLIKYNSLKTIVFDSTNSVIPAGEVINDIAVDSKNNIWIGGPGLIKYDGEQFTVYNTSNSPIPEDNVSSVAVDSKDNIWFTSCRFREGGLVKFDGTSWNVYTPDNSDLPVNLIKSIAIDNYDNVWLALAGTVNDAYLVRISGTNWKIFTGKDLGFEPYYFANIDVNSRNEICGAIDYSLSSLWVHPGPQVFIFDGNDTEQLRISDNARIVSLMVDFDDNLWCAMHGGFAVYNGREWIIDNSTFAEQSAFTIEQSFDGSIWIGTGDGIFINELLPAKYYNYGNDQDLR